MCCICCLRRQISSGVECPFELDLQLFVDDNLQGGETKYALFAVINHEGSTLHGGHYTADVLYRDNWYHVDDDKVMLSAEHARSVATRRTCTSRARGGGAGEFEVSKKNAYVLAYRRKDEDAVRVAETSD